MFYLGKLLDWLKKYREPVSYVFFGGLTTLVNWLVYLCLVNLMGGGKSTVAVLWATVLAQVAAITFAYVTNRKWVFQSRAQGAGKIAWEAVRFFGCRTASIFLDMGIMFVGVSLLAFNDLVMKIISNGLIILANYFFSKIFVFREQRMEGNEKEG